jgi:hypothetical protein
MRILPAACILPILFSLLGPVAVAQETTICTASASQIEQITAGKSDKNAAKALDLSKTGKMLCEAGNKQEARQKFRKAYALLGVEAPATLLQR